MTKTGRIITATLLTIATIGLVVFAVKKGIKPKTLQTQAGNNYITTTFTENTLTGINYSKETSTKIVQASTQRTYYLEFEYTFEWTYTANTNTTQIFTAIHWTYSRIDTINTAIGHIEDVTNNYTHTIGGQLIPSKIGILIQWLEDTGDSLDIGMNNYALYYQQDRLVTLYDREIDLLGTIETNYVWFTEDLDIEVLDAPNIKAEAQNAVNNYNSGYNNGEQTGITTGYNNGYAEGETAGYTAGHETGYAEGWNDADAFDHPIALQPLMLNILTMPFTFISQAFDVTLWPGTQYEFNIANFIKGLIAIATILFIIKMFTSGFSIIGNFTKNTEQEMTMRSDNRKSRLAWKSQKIANKSNKIKKEE